MEKIWDNKELQEVKNNIIEQCVSLITSFEFLTVEERTDYSKNLYSDLLDLNWKVLELENKQPSIKIEHLKNQKNKINRRISTLKKAQIQQ